MNYLRDDRKVYFEFVIQRKDIQYYECDKKDENDLQSVRKKSLHSKPWQNIRSKRRPKVKRK